MPAEVVILTNPLLAPAGTMAVSWAKDMFDTIVEATPLKRTVGVPTLKFAPVSVTGVPAVPEPGKKPNKVG